MGDDDDTGGTTVSQDTPEGSSQDGAESGDGGAGASDRDLPQAYRPLPAVSGGTLLVTADQQWIVASDPDRDLIHIFDLSAETEVVAIELPFGSEPGRVAENRAGRAFVALRRSGEAVAIDLTTGVVLETYQACRNPRGLAFDAEVSELVMACAERVVARIDADGVASAAGR